MRRWRFGWPDDRVYTAVEQAGLSVAHGEFVAIVGPTGCGKSTLLNVAAGLLKPASGTVRIFDAPLTGLNRQAGYLFQADALFPWKTAIDNVAIGLEIIGRGARRGAGAGAELARPRSGSARSATAIRTCCRAASASASASRRS